MLEFCAGGDLSGLIRRVKTLPEATVRGLMQQLAAGLKELRALNLIHRDLKPQNLLLSGAGPDAVLKIADFGFARDLQPQGGLPRGDWPGLVERCAGIVGGWDHHDHDGAGSIPGQRSSRLWAVMQWN